MAFLANGRTTLLGSSLVLAFASRPAKCWRRMAIRFTLLSAPPLRHASAAPRPITRMLSPTDSSALASPQVMVFEGPWQSWQMVTWQASMLGRYFSIHSGVRFCMPVAPQAAMSKLPSGLRLVASAEVSSFSSAAIRPAPMWQPMRSTGMVVLPSAGSCALVIRPAARTASYAAPTANSMSRAITLVALR